MSEYKFTPGPWLDVGRSVYALSEDGSISFKLWFQNSKTCDEELEANARLIAAAPELLQALIKAKDLIRFGQDLNSADEIICAAIAKALGETE